MDFQSPGLDPRKRENDVGFFTRNRAARLQNTTQDGVCFKCSGVLELLVKFCPNLTFTEDVLFLFHGAAMTS